MDWMQETYFTINLLNKNEDNYFMYIWIIVRKLDICNCVKDSFVIRKLDYKIKEIKQIISQHEQWYVYGLTLIKFILITNGSSASVNTKLSEKVQV